MKIAVIGCGNMGMSYATSFLRYKLVSKENLLLVEKDEVRQNALLQQGYKNVTADLNDPRMAEAELIFLAVKPQDFNVLAPKLQHSLQPHHIVVSIMAGKPLAFLQENLGHTFVVRAMPNAPAILGMGITAYTPSDALTFKQIRQVENLLNTTGRSVFLEDESLMDAVTAVSGSGPAYFYFFVRSMMEAAESMGLDESTASLLVKQTMLGAFHVMNNSEKSIEELIQVVASKGGTTEAALRVFHETEIHTHIIQALHAAAARAKALANG